jgi:hypothetical protein
MKYFYLSVFALSCFFYFSASANPFKCKLTAEKKKLSEVRTKIVYRGFTSIGNQRYGIIQIGKKDYQIIEGEQVEGILVSHISAERLDYIERSKHHYILLEFK